MADVTPPPVEFFIAMNEHVRRGRAVMVFDITKWPAYDPLVSPSRKTALHQWLERESRLRWKR
jgi:hypothetical protein